MHKAMSEKPVVGVWGEGYFTIFSVGRFGM